MSEVRRVAAYGGACLMLGWISAGVLDYLGAPYWAAMLILFALVLIVAVGADRATAR